MHIVDFEVRKLTAMGSILVMIIIFQMILMEIFV